MTDVDESSIYSNHILDFIFEDRCVSVVDKTDFDYIPPIAALSKNFVPTKRHSKRLNRPMNNDCILGRENCTLHLDHFNCSKKMKLAPGEPSDPRRPGASGSTSATEVQSDPKINNAQCVVVLEQNIADDAVETETEVSKKKKSRRPKTVVYTPVGANKRKRSYKRRQLDRPEDIEYIPLGAKSEIGKNEVPKMHSDQQLKNISKDENTNLYLPVSNSKTPICVLKKRNYAKTSKPDNTDIIYSSSIRNIDGNHVPKIVLIKEQRSNKIVAIQNNDDTTELHIEEATNSNGNSNDNCKSDNNIGKHILPMRISERRSIAEPLRPQFATIVPNMNDQHAQMRNEIKTPNVRPAEVPFPRHVMNTSDDVPEDLSIKSTRSNRDQNMKQADAFPHRVTQVMFSSEKDRVLPSAPGPSRKYVDQAPLQPPQLQVPQQSPRQVSEPQQHLPIQKLCIHSPQQSPQQYLQSARHYPLHSHLPPQIKSYLQTPQHSPIIQQQNSSLQHSPIMQQQNSTLQHSPIQHSPIQHSPIQHSPIQHSPIQHSPIQHSPLQHSPLQQIQNQFTNASVQQQRMQYMMQQHQAANMMGCQVPLGNPCQMRQQPQTMLQEQYAMQILMHQQYLNEQQRMVQQQQQIAEHLQQSRFSPQQQLLAQQTINRQNENNIITNRPADILRSYPFVPCSPYPQQIRKAPIISPGTQYSSDNSQDYWYNLANLNNMYSTTLQNETNIIPNKAAKKRNAKSAKIATKPVFEEPASKVKRSNTLADFAQDFVNSNANYRATPTNGVDTYNMHAVNNRATISISCPKNIPSAEGSKAAHYENHCTGRHRELFDNMPQQRLMSPHEENFHNIDILRDVRNRVNEFGEYLLNDSSGLTIRKVKANENCENLSVPPLSSASLYNAQNCHNSSTSASVSGRNIMLRTALSSNKSQLSRADVTTVSPSSLEDIIKSKMSPLICDPREMNQMKPKENIAEDIGPMVATFSNHNKRKIMEIRDRTSKRGRMDNNHHFIVQNNIASSGCTVINGVMAEAQTIESIKITTSETESNDFEISSKNIDSENSLIIDENCVVDLSIPQRKNSIATHSNVPEVEIPPANTTPTVADTIDNDYNEVQEMENGVSSHKRTMEDELTSLEEVLSNTHLIHNKTIPKLTEDNKNNNSSPSLSETAQELSFALSASSTGNNSEAVLEIDTEKDVVNENLSCVVQNEFDTENNDEIKNQSSEICDELGHQGSSTENTSEDLDTEKHAGIQIQVSEICGELGDQGTSTTNATEELDTGKDDGIENQVSEISGELDGQGANGSEELTTENDVGIINQICANDDQSTPIANDSAVFDQELNTEEDICIQNQISKSSVKFDDQTNDSEVSVQELNAEEDMGTENQRGVNLDDPDSLTQDSEVLANELATEKDDVAEPVNSPTANDSEILSEGLNTETDDDIKTHISNPIAIEKNSTSEDIEVVVTVTEIENEETETSYAETNFEEMIFQENVISSETVEYAEQHNTIIEIYDDDDINENNLSKQNSALTNNGCELAVRTLEVTVNTPTREVPPQRLVGCYSVDSSDDSSDDEEDDPRSNYDKNKQFEVISISSDSESEPEYIDETIIDSRFRNDLRKKFRKKHFLKKVKKDSKEMTKTARNLRELINDCFHVYVGPNNNNLEGNVNDNFKSVKTVLPEFDQNIRPWQHNSKIFLKRCYDIQLYKFKMNIPEAIVCLKHMLRNISIYLVPLREAKFRFVLECKDLIEDYYMNKYFKTLYPPRMNGNMVIIRLDESDSDGSMEVVTISSQASNCGESVNQEMNVQDKKENGSSSIRNGVLAIKGSEENKRNSDSNLEVESSDENESLSNDSENSEVSQTKDGSFSKPSNDDNVDTDERATPNLKRKLDDLEECNSDVQTAKDSCSEEAKTDDPDDLNKMETFEGDINNNERNISSKVLVENTDFHAENEQISENFPNGKHAKMRKRFHNKKCKEKSNEIDNCESFSDKENDIENENRVNEIKSADFNNFNNENEDSQRDQKVLHRLTSNKNIGDANVVQNTTWKKTSDASSQINSKNDETRKSPELSAAKTVVCLPEASEQLIQNLDLRNSDNSFEFFEDELRSCLENGTSKSLVRANNRNPSAAVVINRDGSSTSRNIFEDCKVFNIELSRSISIPKSLFQFNSMNLKDVYKENDKITILSKVVVEAKPKEILKKYLNSENRNSKKADLVELYKENVADMRDLHQNSGQEIVPKNAIICVKPSQNNLDVKNQQENPFKLPQTTGDRRESEEKKFQDPLPFPNAGTANYTTNTSKPQILASTKTVLPQQRPPNYYYQPFPQNIAQYGPNNQNYSNPHFKLPNLPILHQNAQSTSFPNCSAVQNHLEVPRKSELLAAPSHVNLTHARQNVTASYNKEPNLSNERRPPQPKKLNRCYPRTKMTTPSTLSENQYNYYHQQPPQSVPEPDAMATTSSSWHNAMEPNQNNQFPAQNHFSNIVAPFNRTQQTQNVVFQKMQFLLSILHRGDILSPEEYVREIQILQYHQCPRILLDFYTFITKSQIYVNVFPISFRLFLEYHYAGKLKELEVAFVRYVESHERERQLRLKKN